MCSARSGDPQTGLQKQSHLEFPEQHRRDEIIQLGFLQDAFLDEFDDMQIAIRFGNSMFTPALTAGAQDSQFIFRDEMAIRIRAIAKFPDRVIVGDDESLKPHFLSAAHRATTTDSRARARRQFRYSSP